MKNSYYATAAQLRKLDELAVSKHQMNSLQLMENAGAGASLWIKKVRRPARVLILCGIGNNGGDGFVIARHLDYYGFDVTIALVGSVDRLRGDALHNFQIIQTTSICKLIAPSSEVLADEIAALGDQDIIVDALLGTGAKLPLRPDYASIVSVANRSTAFRVALDIPTGFDCDSGGIDKTCFLANATLTFAALKIGFRQPNAAMYTGQVHLIPIGVPRELELEVFEGSTSNDDL
jgi:NAD(P)H-hydrate epimerase